MDTSEEERLREEKNKRRVKRAAGIDLFYLSFRSISPSAKWFVFERARTQEEGV